MMTDDYRWELINTLRSATLADLLATVPEINQRTFIDAAEELERLAAEVKRLALDNVRAGYRITALDQAHDEWEKENGDLLRANTNLAIPCCGTRKESAKMTDEDRQKLCERLRTEGTGTYQAADEIERLADRLAEAEAVSNLLEIKAGEEIERLATEVESLKNINGELFHELHLWRCGSKFYRSSPNPISEVSK